MLNSVIHIYLLIFKKWVYIYYVGTYLIYCSLVTAFEYHFLNGLSINSIFSIIYKIYHSSTN